MRGMREKGDGAVPIGTMSRIVRWLFAAMTVSLLGFLLGIGGMAAFDAAFALIKLIWIDGWQAFPSPIYPVIVCAAVGTILSIVVALYGKPERPMDAVSEAAEKVDGLEALNPETTETSRPAKRPLPVKLIDFFMPLAGGGPVGVAMGIINLVTSGCSWAKRSLVHLCVRLGLLAQGADFSKRQKSVIYTVGVLGGIVGVGAVADAFGVGMMIPRVEAADFSLHAALLAIALSIGGWALGLLYIALTKVAHSLWAKAGRFQKLLPLACGIVLGLSMIFLPHAGLPGSDAYSYQLLGDWQSLAPAILLLTAIVRTALIALCLNLGWSGGPFLPLVYSSLCLGLSIAGLTGLGAGTCVAAAVSGILVAFTGQPLMGVAAFMCCPLESLPVIAIATVVTSVLPRPSALKGDFARARMRPSGKNQ